jgi:hypothetical protein
MFIDFPARRSFTDWIFASRYFLQNYTGLLKPIPGKVNFSFTNEANQWQEYF